MTAPSPFPRGPWPGGEPAPLCVVRGGGDLATGAARRLYLAGLRVLVLERAAPWCVRRRTAFASAVTAGAVEIDGVLARFGVLPELATWDWDHAVAVVVCPDQPAPPGLRPDLLVDARVLKRGHDTTPGDAPLVIGVGPGFAVGRDCDAAVETARGHDLGRVLYTGATLTFDGVPGPLGGERARRVVRSPIAGDFRALVAIGDHVEAGQTVGVTDGRPVDADLGGVVRGLLAPGYEVEWNWKLADIDPRCDTSACFEISDKALAIGGGVVEAVLSWLNSR